MNAVLGLRNSLVRMEKDRMESIECQRERSKRVRLKEDRTETERTGCQLEST